MENSSVLANVRSNEGRYRKLEMTTDGTEEK